MEEELKSGTSTNNPWLSEQDTTTNLGTFRIQEEPITCKSGALTLDGGKSLDMRTISSSTGTITKDLMLKVAKMKRVIQ